MKKTIFILVLALLFVLPSCSSNENVTPDDITQEDNIIQEETTQKQYTLVEMSPDTMDVALPFDIETNTKSIDFDSFVEIEAKDSMLSETQSVKILKSEQAEYFFSEDNIKILVLFGDKNGNPAYSASYKVETGALEFLGDDKRTWYFDEDGNLECLVYTFAFEDESVTRPSIFTFYDSEGKRDFIRTYGGSYTGDLTPLSESGILEYQQKYSYTIEIIAEY